MLSFLEKKNNSYTGVSLEDNKLRIATVSFQKDKMVLESLRTITLLQSARKSHQAAAAVDDSPFGDLDEDMSAIMFSLDEDPAEAKEEAPKKTKPKKDDFDMLGGAGVEGMQETNANQVANLLMDVDPKNLQIGLNIPVGDAYFQIFTDLDAKKLGKKKLLNTLKERVQAVTNQAVGNDQIRYFVRPDGSIFVATIGTGIDSLDLIDSSLLFYPGKLSVKDIVPDEAVLVGLTRANYKLEEGQFTCIIHAEDERTAVLFLQGAQIFAILPIIAEGRKKPRFARTVFSKILFELDRGRIPTIDRIIITSDTEDEKLGNLLRDEFEEIEVEAFQFNPDTFVMSDEVEVDQLQDHLRAIGVAWATGSSSASKSDFPSLSFIPSRVTNRQQVLKLEWHGYTLLGLIALSPLVFNFFLQDLRNELRSIEQQSVSVDAQVADIREVADAVDQMTTDFNDYNARLALLDTLSTGTRKWSVTLSQINTDVRLIRSMWLSSIKSLENGGLNIEGSSTARDRIPLISNSFENAIILSVQEREARTKVHDFKLLVTRITANDSIFNPPRPVYQDFPADSLEQAAMADSTKIAKPDSTVTPKPAGRN